MEAKNIDVILEDYGTKPVPIEKTRSWFDMGIVIMGIYICIPLFMVSGMLGNAATLGVVVAAILLGQVILTVISIGTGLVGAQTRLSTAMNSQFTFGRNGNVLIALILAIGAFGWFGFQLELFGGAVIGAVKILTNDSVHLPRTLVIVGGGILMSLTAIYGFRAIEKLSLVVIPILLLLFLVTLIKVHSGVSFADVVAKAPKQALPLGTLISIVVGTYAVGAVIQPDLTRYAKGKGHAALGMVFGMMLGAPIVYILASYVGKVAGQSDFTTIMLSFHSGWWGLFAMFAIVFATWTSNDNNLYSSALAFNSIFPKLRKWMLTAIGGALGTIFAVIGILGQLVNWLIILSVTVPPIGAVMAADFFLYRSEAYQFEQAEQLPPIRWEALSSWAVGGLVGFLTHFKVFTITSAPALDSMMAAFIAHIVIMAATGRKFRTFALTR